MSRDKEFRVTWRWREGPHDLYPLRHKVFKTQAGLERYLAKLTSNGGRYDKVEDGEGYRSGELVVTQLRLHEVSVERREVGPWIPDATIPTAWTPR